MDNRGIFKQVRPAAAHQPASGSALPRAPTQARVVDPFLHLVRPFGIANPPGRRTSQVRTPDFGAAGARDPSGGWGRGLSITHRRHRAWSTAYVSKMTHVHGRQHAITIAWRQCGALHVLAFRCGGALCPVEASLKKAYKPFNLQWRAAYPRQGRLALQDPRRTAWIRPPSLKHVYTYLCLS